MHFRILKVIATSGFLRSLECTKFVFGRGSSPDTTEGAYSAPSDPLAGFRGTLLLRGRLRKGRGEGTPPPNENSWIRVPMFSDANDRGEIPVAMDGS